MSDDQQSYGGDGDRAAGADSDARKTSAPEQEWSTTIGIALGILIWVGIIGGIVYAVSGSARAFIDAHFWWAAAAAAVPGALAFVPAVGEMLRAASATRLAGFVTFGVLPLILILLACTVLVQDPYRSVIVRLEFLFLVTLFPGSLFYLFITSRRESLLNEFIGNLDRLGLLSAQPVNRIADLPDTAGPEDGRPVEITNPLGYYEMEDPESRDRRLRTYLERFEAIYGRLDDELVAETIRSTDRRQQSAAADAAGPDDEPDLRRRHVWTSVFSIATVVPIIGATVLIAIGWLITLPPTVSSIDRPTPAVSRSGDGGQAAVARLGPLQPAAILDQDERPVESPETPKPPAPRAWYDALYPTNPQPVQFAFLGAYFFSIQMLFRRYVRRDLGANAYLAVALRIVLATIGVWVAVEALAVLGLGTFVSDEAKLVVAFAIGAFPVIVWKLVGAVAKKVPGMQGALPSLKSDLPLNELNGLTIWHETRLEEEDVENVQNMATADVIGLMLHTRIPPERIVAWVDEAILYLHLGADEIKNPSGLFLTQLRPRGIRNATSLVAGYQRAEQRNGEKDFLAMADGTPNRLLTLLDTITTYPNLILVRRWRQV